MRLLKLRKHWPDKWLTHSLINTQASANCRNLPCRLSTHNYLMAWAKYTHTHTHTHTHTKRESNSVSKTISVSTSKDSSSDHPNTFSVPLMETVVDDSVWLNRCWRALDEHMLIYNSMNLHAVLRRISALLRSSVNQSAKQLQPHKSPSGQPWNSPINIRYHLKTTNHRYTDSTDAVSSFSRAESNRCLSVHPLWKWSALKGLVYPKMKNLSLITHPHVVPNP